jgi:hypothetical protein
MPGKVSVNARASVTAGFANDVEAVIRRIKNPSGSYTVNADCRGSASLEKTRFGTANWEFVIVGDGNKVFRSQRRLTADRSCGYSRSSLALTRKV